MFLPDWQETTMVKDADYDPGEYSLEAMENSRAKRANKTKDARK